MNSDTVRAFWAICPPPSVIDAAAEFARQLRSPCEKLGLKVAWVDADALHLTLKFLGNVALSDLPLMLQHVEHGIAGLAQKNQQTNRPESRLCLRGLGAFPSVVRPRVLTAEVHGESGDADLEPLFDLQRGLESWLDELGFAREERPFHPHLTLGRVREGRERSFSGTGRDLMKLFTPESGERRLGEAFPIEEVILYESRLGSDGAKHTPLYRLSLQGNQRRT